MSLESDLSNVSPTPPKGWEPFSEHTDAIGSAIVHLPRPDCTERDLLIQSGFNPDAWQISGSVQTRKWMRYDQEWQYYFKFNVVAGESPEIVEEHVEDLVRHIRRRQPKINRPMSGDDAFAILLSDWQIGKRQGHDGTPQTVDRILEAVSLAKDRVRELRRIGRKMPTLLVAGMGDIVEDCTGHYPGQSFTVDRNRRDQNRIARELVTHVLDELLPMFSEATVLAVGGNHGENLDNGQKISDDADNDDVAIFETVKEAFDRAGHSVGITWVIPQRELSLAVTVGGVRVGFAHGHKFGRGSTAQQKAMNWWQGQDFGYQAVRDCQVLCSAHYHHFSAVTSSRRTHLQTPAMDPGSAWYENISGTQAPAGMLTVRLTAEEPLGFADLQLLGHDQRESGAR